jgi:hypothetical protein
MYYSSARCTFLTCVVSSPNDNQRNHCYTHRNDRLTDSDSCRSSRAGGHPQVGNIRGFGPILFYSTRRHRSILPHVAPAPTNASGDDRWISYRVPSRLAFPQSVELRIYIYPVQCQGQQLEWEVESGRRSVASSDPRFPVRTTNHDIFICIRASTSADG